MTLRAVTFLSGWIPQGNGSFVMEGTQGALEIENNGGDFLLMEYVFPGREEERSVLITVKVLDQRVGQFRAFYSSPFYIGFNFPASPSKKIPITLEIDRPFLRTDGGGAAGAHGLALLHLELLDSKKEPERCRTYEAKSENLRDHFERLLSPSRQAQPLPIALLIEPTTRCNMDCVMCARNIPGHRREEECDLADEYLPILGRAMRGVQASRIQGLGEPLVSRNFIPLMDFLESNRVHIVTFNTNGDLFDERMAQFLVEKAETFEDFRISFSLDAATQEVYHKIRGKDLNRTLKNIRYLVHCKNRRGLRSPRVAINMTLSRTNIADLPKFIRLAHDLGVQVEINHLALDKNYESIHSKRGDQSFLFDYPEQILSAHPQLYNEYLRQAEDLAKSLNVTVHKAQDVTYFDLPDPKWLSWIKEALRRSGKRRETKKEAEKSLRPVGTRDPYYERLPICLLPWTQMVISSRGDISLCCVQGTLDHLRNYRSLEEAWNSETLCRIREQLLQGSFPPECQVADCTVKRWKSKVCIIHQ
jgi:MoaA/NifB/PqqE/SkfB family radical SAM enzyme